MAVYKIFANADATLYSSDISKNTGLDEILEVGVKNYAATTNGVYLAHGVEDIRRSIIKFSDSDLAIINSINPYGNSNFQTSLRLYLANADNLATTYSLYFHSMNQSWDMGTGKFVDYPNTINGVCWNSPTAYVTGSTTWTSVINYYTVPGGGSYIPTSSGFAYTTQSFGYADNKDVNADVTNIYKGWYYGIYPNNGILVRYPPNIETNSGSYIQTKFFSTDTHTIYPPTLEFKWDDSTYITGSTISDDDFVVNFANNKSEFKYGTKKYRVRLSTRKTFPTRQFVTSSVYLNTLLLPSSSYWAIQDYKTEETVIDFDTNYTKISSDGTYNYFDLYMNGLEPERYYKLLVKTIVPSSQESINIDSDLIFKIVR
jgi:hypothetical protein